MVRTPYVSKHALRRYFERILLVNVCPPPAMTDAELSEFYAAHVDTTIPTIVHAILTPAVCVGIMAGFPMVATRRFRAKVAPDGTVTTILEPFPHIGGRLIIRTDREAARIRERAHRRERSVLPIIEAAANGASS